MTTLSSYSLNPLFGIYFAFYIPFVLCISSFSLSEEDDDIDDWYEFCLNELRKDNDFPLLVFDEHEWDFFEPSFLCEASPELIPSKKSVE